MEVDSPSLKDDHPSDNQTNSLKRSNSAPMLAEVSDADDSSSKASDSITSQSSTPNHVLSSSWSCRGSESMERIRRASTSSAHLPHVSTPVKPSTRLYQIKREETQSPSDSEVAREREYQVTMQLSQSCEDLSVSDQEPMSVDKRPRNFQEPLQILTSFSPHASSPSPNRSAAKQCFSPSLQQPVHPLGHCATASPSPTRKTFRRSLSPIAVTIPPSRFTNLKRKFEECTMSDSSPSIKRFQPSSLYESSYRYSEQLSSSLDDSSNSSPSMDNSPPVPTSNLHSSVPLIRSSSQHYNTSSPSLPTVSAGGPPLTSVFSFHGKLSRDSLESAAQSTPPHSSETSEGTDSGDVMVTDDSGCDTSQQPGEVVMEDREKVAKKLSY